MKKNQSYSFKLTLISLVPHLLEAFFCFPIFFHPLQTLKPTSLQMHTKPTSLKTNCIVTPSSTETSAAGSLRAFDSRRKQARRWKTMRPRLSIAALYRQSWQPPAEKKKKNTCVNPSIHPCRFDQKLLFLVCFRINLTEKTSLKKLKTNFKENLWHFSS